MDRRGLSLDERTPLGVASIAINSIFVGLAALALGIRFNSRRIQGLELSFNDYAALVAWPLTVALLVTSCFLVAIRGGAGQHVVDVNPADIVLTLKIIPAATCVWAAANTLVKLSILHFYLTIFGLRNVFRYATYIVMTFVLSFGVGLILQAFLICRPFDKNWDPLLPGTCGSSKAAFLADGIVNVIIDLTMIILPMPIVWQLQMSQQRKVALTVVFGLGILVCTITIIRVVIAIQFDFDDYTYDIAKVGIVTDLETCMGLIVACLPMFPPTFNRILHGKKKSDSRSHISSGVLRLRSKGPKPQAFRSIDDFYPLTDLEGSRAQNEITGPDGMPDSIPDSFVKDQNMDAALAMHPQSSIKVKKDWEVRSDEAV